MIQSVDRAIQILQALSSQRRMGVTELASHLGLAKGTVHGLLQTMLERALVEQDRGSGKYALGPALLVMGNVYLNSHELRVRSLRWADHLASSTGWSVRVGVLAWPDVVIVHHVPAHDAPVPVSELGLGIPAHASAIGKAILAFRDDAEDLLSSMTLSRLTGRTITEPEQLVAALGPVAAGGVATASHEAVVGEAEAAAAVFDSTGTVIGAISVVLPLPPDGALESPVVQAVSSAARSLSLELGADGWPARR